MQFNAILLDSDSDAVGGVGPTTVNEKNLDNEKGTNAWVTSTTSTPRGHQQLRLWGLSLGMTLDLIAYMLPPSTPFSADLPQDEVIGLGTSIAPSMT